ncbi:helix-turn-helix domain-containing protein [Paenibacillus polymyxa]|uniref:helix-turn-helix domain-containing protein n=1 Tax=Paenibacillus polymyxa TaxID=1406 RepID=UPI0025B6506F|nr:helix-turn-helix transcriptional regulator [Paenibacillus polymyxa]MDN4086015.1 helix-turn-helix transcriptional regulator [Paenibacillus polymyxa]MDN4108336.1 helix-turn-helix transcriptional regulator [Paenibacillus polymyxa]
MNPYLDSIGKRVKLLRLQHSMSMSELAEALNIKISQSTVSNIEADKVSPNAEVIIALSQYFNVSTDWLLTGQEWSHKFSSDDDIALAEIVEETEKLYRKMTNLRVLARVRKLNRAKMDLIPDDDDQK